MPKIINSTDFIIPIKSEQIEEVITYLNSNKDWTKYEHKDTNYLFSYANSVFKDTDKCATYKYNNDVALDGSVLKEKLDISFVPYVSDVYVNCFATGIMLLEIYVKYDDMPIKEVIDFANYFRVEKYCFFSGGVPLKLFIDSLFSPKVNIVTFFANKDAQLFRRRAFCYHMINLPEETDETVISNYVMSLKRSNNSHSEYSTAETVSEYDMTYRPNSYLYWGGSQEGLVCIASKPPEGSSVSYLENYHYEQLIGDYRRMFLLLLNQRFSAISYLEDIVAFRGDEKVNDMFEKVVALKTMYSFKNVSDDMHYQNIYIKMYKLLDIDSLLADLDDINGKFEDLKAKKNLESMRKTDQILAILSIFTVFSVLIDASSYLDRWWISPEVSTKLSLGIMITGLVVCIVTWTVNYFKRKKKYNR